MKNPRSYEHVLGFALEHPWALTESMRTIVAGILARRLAGQELDPTELAALSNRSQLPKPAAGTVALIPIFGVIAPRMNMLSDISGGTTFEALTAQLHEALDNEAVRTIVFDVDSPGGNVAGATEFAREVMKARTKKPIIAQANFLMASAAFWTMACATEVVASPSAMVGGIGVYTIVDDVTEALAKMGIKRTVLSAGKYKAEGADGKMSDEGQAHIQGLITTTYDRMAGDIAKGRGVTPAAVRSGYGEGRTVNADEALRLGMIDRIATLAETLARLRTPAPAGASARALDLAPIAATDQEPPPAATSQEPPPADRTNGDAAWINASMAALLELEHSS